MSAVETLREAKSLINKALILLDDAEHAIAPESPKKSPEEGMGVQAHMESFVRNNRPGESPKSGADKAER